MATRALSSGTLARWDDERGFGFISPIDESVAVFVHISAFPRGSRRPAIGDTVRYSIEITPEGKTRAARASYVGVSRASGDTPSGSRSVSGAYLVVSAFLALLIAATVAWESPLWILVLYLVASVACYAVYAADKAAARNGGWRIPEGTLLFLGLIGGWPGALVAQQRLRHKTIKPSFRFAFWVSVLVNIGALLLVSAPVLRELSLQLTV